MKAKCGNLFIPIPFAEYYMRLYPIACTITKCRKRKVRVLGAYARHIKAKKSTTIILCHLASHIWPQAHKHIVHYFGSFAV